MKAQTNSEKATESVKAYCMNNMLMVYHKQFNYVLSRIDANDKMATSQEDKDFIELFQRAIELQVMMMDATGIDPSEVREMEKEGTYSYALKQGSVNYGITIAPLAKSLLDSALWQRGFKSCAFIS